MPRPGPPRTGPRSGLRLFRLHLVSRHVPAALVALAVFGALLRASLYWHWTLASGPLSTELPVLIEIGAASVIAVTTYSPFGEPERATGPRLARLRLATAIALTGAAVSVLAAAAAVEHLSGGTFGIVRNVAGITGIGLLSAAIIGGALAWIAPMVYAVVAESAIAGAWTSPWTWPARPPHDRGAMICAVFIFAAGLAITTVRGARDSARE